MKFLCYLGDKVSNATLLKSVFRANWAAIFTLRCRSSFWLYCCGPWNDSALHAPHFPLFKRLWNLRRRDANLHTSYSNVERKANLFISLTIDPTSLQSPLPCQVLCRAWVFQRQLGFPCLFWGIGSPASCHVLGQDSLCPTPLWGLMHLLQAEKLALGKRTWISTYLEKFYSSYSFNVPRHICHTHLMYHGKFCFVWTKFKYKYNVV